MIPASSKFLSGNVKEGKKRKKKEKFALTNV